MQETETHESQEKRVWHPTSATSRSQPVVWIVFHLLKEPFRPKRVILREGTSIQ